MKSRTNYDAGDVASTSSKKSIRNKLFDVKHGFSDYDIFKLCWICLKQSSYLLQDNCEKVFPELFVTQIKSVENYFLKCRTTQLVSLKMKITIISLQIIITISSNLYFFVDQSNQNTLNHLQKWPWYTYNISKRNSSAFQSEAYCLCNTYIPKALTIKTNSISLHLTLMLIDIDLKWPWHFKHVLVEYKHI